MYPSAREGLKARTKHGEAEEKREYQPVRIRALRYRRALHNII